MTIPNTPNLQTIQNILRFDIIKLEWHPDVDEIDSMGLEHEFRESESLQSQSEDIEDKQFDDLKWDINPKLTRYQRRFWTKILRKYLKSFADPKEQNLGKLSSKFDLNIDANISLIKSAQSYHASPMKYYLIRDVIKKLSDLKIIQSSFSSIISLIIIVIQKDKSRFCIDLREVNSKMISDWYILSRQDTIFRSIGRAMFFSTLNYNKDYHQFELTTRARLLIIFIIEDEFWEYIHISFDLKNASTHFQWIMNVILSNYRWDFILAYIDDIMIFSQIFDEYLEYYSLILKILKKIDLILKETKCHFCYNNIELLDHHISYLDLSTQTEKIKAILIISFLEIIKKTQEILNMFNYYRIFIKHFAWIIIPLYDDLKKQFDESSHHDLKTRAHIHNKQ